MDMVGWEGRIDKYIPGYEIQGRRGRIKSKKRG